MWHAPRSSSLMLPWFLSAAAQPSCTRLCTGHGNVNVFKHPRCRNTGAYADDVTEVAQARSHRVSHRRLRGTALTQVSSRSGARPDRGFTPVHLETRAA